MPFITRKSLYGLVVVAAVAALIVVGFVWSGLYNVGADDPHTRPVLAAMQSLREHSIRARSKDLQVPKLDDAELVRKGAGEYAAMCTGCHLAPGIEDTETRIGLYPQPPELAHTRMDPKEAFWVIKHGIKMSAMPAWGATHDDPTIWSMVAFLQKLPALTPAQYDVLVEQAPAGEGHHHDGEEHDVEPAHAHGHDHDHDHDHSH